MPRRRGLRIRRVPGRSPVPTALGTKPARLGALSPQGSRRCTTPRSASAGPRRQCLGGARPPAAQTTQRSGRASEDTPEPGLAGGEEKSGLTADAGSIATQN
ncbi:Hypothetical predicted protein [Marmota monax]|uniref:Uncharacterized protein n=1 Tax=Marmota monax TaxID=9995 RepID=A0A5E4CTI5_MARMO|nr:hypothetical protein GHT09_010000 [Marmota monax]VTJ84469.1 Hypothetical predicted protein [Marmota monax]